MTGGAAVVGGPCPICGGKLRPVYAVHDVNDAVPGEWEVAVCDGCGMGQLHPMPSHSEISGFYRDVFYDQTGRRFHPWVEGLRRRLGAARGKVLNRLCPARGRLLDFGSGAGHFGEAMRRLGWDVVDFDPYRQPDAQAPNGPAPGAAADESRVAETGGNLPFAAKSFDAITLWYSFEHMRDPRAVLWDIFRVLKPDGVLLVAVQDFSSIQARVFGRRWLILDPPRHLYQYSPENLGRLCRQEGFEPIELTRRSIEFGPFTILQSALNALVGNKNYLFRMLKSRDLGGRLSFGDLVGGCASLVVAPILVPVALIAYFVLLSLGSSDVFSLYLRRNAASDGTKA